jgi:hypothetical protein
MTPKQKLLWAILDHNAREYDGPPAPEFPCEDIDEEMIDGLGDSKYEVRCGDLETELSCESSRHYESNAVAMKFPDGSWVGWTFWCGGGKHGEPEAIEWINNAYDIECKEEEKLVIVRTFSRLCK